MSMNYEETYNKVLYDNMQRLKKISGAGIGDEIQDEAGTDEGEGSNDT